MPVIGIPALSGRPDTTTEYEPGGSVATIAESAAPAIGGNAPTDVIIPREADSIPACTGEALVPLASVGIVVHIVAVAIAFEFPS